MQPPLIEVDSGWCPPANLPDYEGAPCISIDTETHDPYLLESGSGARTGTGFPVGISAAAAGHEDIYLPFAHFNGGNLDREIVIRWAQEQFRREDQPKIFANAQYDLRMLRAIGIEVKGPIYDVQTAAPLLDENRRSYSLDSLGRDYLGHRKDEKLLKDAAKSWNLHPKKDLAKLPPQYVGPYAEMDARLTLQVWEHQRPILERQGLWDLFLLESRLHPLLLEMHWRGVRIDVDGADRLREKYLKEEKEILDGIWRETKMAVELWKPDDLAKLFESLSIPVPTTATGRPSIKSEWLENIDHPVARLISRARTINKARTSFVDRLLGAHEHQGRIHAEFHPLRTDDGGAVTGRFSSSNPNLQNIPARGEIGADIRGLFLPEEGCVWLSADWSQQEPRLMAHYANLLNLEGASDVVRAYKEDSSTDFHQLVADLSGLPRKQAKTISLGLAYGMGKRRLAHSLGLSYEDAERLMAKYAENVPWLQGLSDTARRTAADRGIIRTTLGRRSRFDLWEPAKSGFHPAKVRAAAEREYGLPLRRGYTHKALNKLIQGSAADCMKAALVQMWEKYEIVPHMTIHDEVCLSVPKARVTKGSTLAQRELVRCVVHTMLNCVPDLTVPMSVDVERGPDWGHLEPVELSSHNVVTEPADVW